MLKKLVWMGAQYMMQTQTTNVKTDWVTLTSLVCSFM